MTCSGQVVARYRRCWAQHQTITDVLHAQAAAAMRRTCLRTTTPATAPAKTDALAEVEVEQRRLSDYDALLGIEEVA